MVMHDFIDQIQSFSEVHLALLSCLQFILVVILNTIYLSYSRNSVSSDGLLEMCVILKVTFITKQQTSSSGLQVNFRI